MSSAQEFWELVLDVWNTGIYGVDVGQVLMALGVFILFLILRRVFSSVVIGILHTWTSRTRSQVDDKLLEALREPLRFVFVVAGFYAATRVAPFPEAVDAIFTKITRSLIAFTIFWSLYRLVGADVVSGRHPDQRHRPARPWAAQPRSATSSSNW